MSDQLKSGEIQAWIDGLALDARLDLPADPHNPGNGQTVTLARAGEVVILSTPAIGEGQHRGTMEVHVFADADAAATVYQDNATALQRSYDEFLVDPEWAGKRQQGRQMGMPEALIEALVPAPDAEATVPVQRDMPAIGRASVPGALTASADVPDEQLPGFYL